MLSDEKQKFKDIQYELFECQSEIIKLQSDALTLAIQILMQYEISDDDFLPITEKINLAASIRAEHRL